MSTTPQTTARPQWVTDLPEGAKACLVCGVAVTEPGEVVPFYNMGREGVRRLKAEFFELTRCARCQATHERAVQLFGWHPALEAAHGDAGVHRLECALNALDLVGVGFAARLGDSTQAIHRLMEHLANDGGRTRWAMHLAPVTTAWADDDLCAVSAWAWVEEERRQAIRNECAAMLLESIEKEQMIPCPDPTGGCMMCGLSQVRGLPSKKADVWRWVKASRAALGGPTTPGPDIHGAMCAECYQACWDEGTVCISALERSLLGHLGIDQPAFDPIEIEGIKAWRIVREEHPTAKAQPTRWAFASLPAEGLRAR
jgi:hypothetical protein